MAIDLADETEGEVELGVVLPPSAGNVAHRGEQCLTHRKRRTQGYEQAVHAPDCRAM
jgi:hypothetical protein